MWYVCELKADRSVPPAQLGTRAYPIKPFIAKEFGEHTSRDEAVKALVLVFYPEHHDSSIEHIKRISKEFLSGTMKTHKILKL